MPSDSHSSYYLRGSSKIETTQIIIIMVFYIRNTIRVFRWVMLQTDELSLLFSLFFFSLCFFLLPPLHFKPFLKGEGSVTVLCRPAAFLI